MLFFSWSVLSYFLWSLINWGPVDLHCGRENWKRSYISSVRPNVYTNPSWKRSFSRAFFKPKELNEKHFENGAFENDDVTINHVISLTEFSSNTNPKWPVIVVFSDFSGVGWSEDIWLVFRVKSLFSNFPGVVVAGFIPKGFSLYLFPYQSVSVRVFKWRRQLLRRPRSDWIQV